jgi:hypothetical protein
MLTLLAGYFNVLPKKRNVAVLVGLVLHLGCGRGSAVLCVQLLLQQQGRCGRDL